MNQLSYQNGLLFTQAYKQVRLAIYKMLEPYGLSPSHWTILGFALNASEGIRLATIAKEMDVKAPLITVLCNELIEMGLVVRLPHHTDKRAKLLIPTAQGKKVAKDIEKKIDAEISRLLHGMSVPELKIFRKTLETIIANGASS